MNLKLALSLVSLTGMAAAVSAAPIVHNYDLKNVLWKLSFSMDRGMIAGDVTNTLTLTEGSSNVQLHCADLNVSKVLVDGIKATFTIADDKLTIKLPKPAASGQTLKVRTIYTGSPVNGFYFVPDSRSFPSKTGMVYTQGEGEDNHYWLPTYDSPDDKATTECYVTVPKTWTAISNGKLLGVTPAGAMRTFHWKMDQPYSTYLISLVAGEYVKGSDQWHGIPVDFYVPTGLLAQGKASFGETSKMIDLYSKLTGVNYPYPKFAQEVVADFMFGGMENVTCVTQTIRTLHAAGTEPVNDSTYLVAHELAHQWFGDLITCKTWEHLWLNEGFATTLPIYLARANHGVDAYDIARYRNFEGAIDTFGARGRKDVPGLAGSAPTVMMGSVYDGGCSRIMMLARMLGESTFWAGIHTFLEKYKFQPATTQEFFDVMSKVSHQDLNPFMRQWFYTSTTPSLTATVSDGNLVIDQLQPYYTLDLPVWSLDGDSWVKNFIHVEGAQSKLKLGDLAAKPLLIDPEVWTPMELHYAIPMTEHDVYEMYRRAPNVAQKARIISGMFDSISVSQRIAIGHGEKYYDLLSMIAGKVGQEGISFLLELTRNADARVVNAAVTNLGNLTLDEAATSRLKEIVKSSSNETIREHATQALLNNTNEGTLAESTWSKKAFDDGYRVMALDWWGKHSPDAARARSMEILRHPDSEPVRITAIRVLGRVKDKPDEDFVMRALVKVAQETSYNARNAAIQSLGQLGNKAAIPYLKPIATHAPNGIKGTASTVIDQLSKIP